MSNPRRRPSRAPARAGLSPHAAASTVLLAALLVLGTTPGVAAAGAAEPAPAEPPGACTEPRTAEPPPDHGPQPAGVDAGCRTWSIPGAADAVASAGDGTVVTATVDANAVTVRLVDATTGHVDWTATAPDPDRGAAPTHVDLVLDRSGEAAYVGWHSYAPDDRHATFHDGGIAKVALDGERVAWTRAGGTASLDVSRDGERVLYGTTTGGSLPYRDADLRVTAVDASDGSRAWQASTDAWWAVHAYQQFGADDPPRCAAGPAEVLVGPDGQVFAARAQACSSMPGALAILTSDGEVSQVTTYPAGLEDEGAPGPRQTDAALAVHPAGHLVYVAGTHYVGAFDARSGEEVWGWEGNEGWCTDADRGCTTPAGPSFYQAEGRYAQGVDVAVTPWGQVLVSLFDDSAVFEDHVVPRLVVLDGVTGEDATPSPTLEHPATLPASRPEPGEAEPPQTRLHVPDHGTAAFAVYRAGGEARALGYLLSGDTTGPVWEALDQDDHAGTTPERLGSARDLAAVGRTVVVGGEATSGHATGPALSPLNALDAAREAPLEPAPDEASPAGAAGTAAKAATGAAHGSRMLEGVPTVVVEAGDTVRAHVNITEPGEYYVVVEGVHAGERFAFQRPFYGPDEAEDSGEAGPFDGCDGGTTCPPGPWMEANARTCRVSVDDGGPLDWAIQQGPQEDVCRRSDPGVCADDVDVSVPRPGNVEDNCWTTGRGEPATVTVADRASGRDVENGSALFGPVVLTEGRYAVTEVPAGEDWLEKSAKQTADVTERCLLEPATGEHPDEDARLVACLDVNVQAAGHEVGTGTLEGSQSQGRGGSSGGCDYQLVERSTETESVLPIQEPGRKGGRILQSSLMMSAIGIERYYDADRDRCAFNTGTTSGRVTFFVNGSTTFTGATEWAATFFVDAGCEDRWGGSVHCTDERWHTQLQAIEPSSCLPDQDDLYVDRLADDPGTTGAEKELIDAGRSFLEGLVKKAVGEDVFFYIDTAKDLFSVLETWTGASCEGDRMDECGVGCQEWNWAVTEERETFLHRPILRAEACGETTYPVRWGLQNWRFAFDTVRGSTFASWTYDGSQVTHDIPLTYQRPWGCP